ETLRDDYRLHWIACSKLLDPPPLITMPFLFPNNPQPHFIETHAPSINFAKLTNPDSLAFYVTFVMMRNPATYHMPLPTGHHLTEHFKRLRKLEFADSNYTICAQPEVLSLLVYFVTPLKMNFWQNIANFDLLPTPALLRASLKPITILGWDPFSLKGEPGRLDLISDTCRSYQAILCVGTKIRQRTPDTPHHVDESLHHHWVHFGWGRGAHTNSSAGCSVALAKRHFRRSDIVKILHPPTPDLRGRAGAVEVHRGPLRLRFVTAYFPPRPNGPGQHRAWRHGCQRLWSWVLTAVRDVPSRVTPILFTDLNQGLGRRARQPFTDTSIGPHQGGDETEFGRYVHDQMLRNELTAYNTHADVGYTYYGPKRSRSRIDYFIGPDNVTEIIKYIRLNWKIHSILRCLHHAPDHIPMAMQLKVPVSSGSPLQHHIPWDWGLLAAGLQVGHQRATFIQDVATTIESHREAFRVIKMDQFPTRHNALLAHIIRECSRKYYTKEGQQPHWYQQARHDRLDLLKLRAHHRARRLPFNSTVLRDIQRQLRAHQRWMDYWWKASLDQDIRDAWASRDLSRAAHLTYLRAGRRTGPRRRSCLALPSTRPAAAEYTAALGELAINGGMTATPAYVSMYIDDPATIPRMLERANDLAPVGEFTGAPDTADVEAAAE
ncbi:unnamed protein product, partial [Prorocentrum cordatum]